MKHKGECLDVNVMVIQKCQHYELCVLGKSRLGGWSGQHQSK